MNGATAEPCARMTTPPSTSSPNTIGIIHQSLASHRNPRSSPPMDSFIRKFFITRSSSLLDDVLPEDQHVHPTPAERAERFGRSVDDRLALEIERRIEHDGHARGVPERGDQPVVPGGRLPVNRLEPCRPV